MKIYLLPLLISIIVMGISTVIAYYIAGDFNPSSTEDDPGYISFRRITESLFYGILSAALAFYVSVRILKQRKKNKYPFDKPLR